MLRALAALPRAVLDNPVFSRQMAVTLSGTKLALVFLFTNVVLIASTIISINAGIDEPRLRWTIDQSGLGLVLRAINSSVIFGLLAVLLPLQVARLFEAQRLDHVFDQLVVTGVRPARLHFGNWASAMAFAAAVLAATLPYQALAHMVRGASLLDIAGDYAILFAYSNVIVLVTMAIAVMVTEFLAAPIAILLFIALGLLALTPVPTVLNFWTPVRWFLNIGSEPLYFTDTPLSGFYYSAAVFGQEIPGPILAAVLWGLFVALALVVLALGPSHRFTPGLNNFGNVVLRGDRKRSRLRTLRFHLNRRVEMAFLYENRPRRWLAWDWALRSLSILAAAVVFWTIFIGWIFNPLILGKGKLDWQGMQVYTSIIGGLGLAFGLLVYGESRDRVYERDRLGPFRVPREALSLVFFAVLLGLFIAFTYLPNALPLQSTIGQIASNLNYQGKDIGFLNRELITMKEHLEALPGRIEILAIFALNLFLLSRLMARISLTAGAARAKLFIAGLVLLFGPVILVPLHQEKVIKSGTLARAAFASPCIALWESFDPEDRWIRSEGQGTGKELYWMIQGGLAGALVLLIVALHARRRFRNRRSGAVVPSPRALAAGALILMALAPGIARAGEDFSIEVVRGFGGHGFNVHFDYFTLTISRPDPGPGGDSVDRTAEFWLETEEGERYMEAETVEVPPGTRRLVRFAPDRGTEYRNAANPVRLVVRLNGASRILEVPPLSIDPPEKIRFLAVNQDGKVPPLLPTHQSWVGIKPELLPERLEAYVGCDFVLVGLPDFGAWTAPQRRALHDFLRSGGSIVFHGAIDERSLASSLEWAEILNPAEPPRTEVREISFRIHRLRETPVVWTDGDGPGALPVLQLRSFGPGLVGHLAVDPLLAATAQRFGGPERFWKMFEDRVPTGLCEESRMFGFNLPWTRRAGGRSLLAVGAYFAIYMLILGPVMLLLFRSRRKRFWVWAYAPAVSALFVAAAPWAFRWILSEPSQAEEQSVTFVGQGGESVRFTQVMINSTGRQEHRLSIPLKDVTAIEGSRDSRLSLLGTSVGDGPLLVPRFSIAPWGHRGLYLLSRGEAGPAAEVRGRISKQVKQASWRCEVEGLRPFTKDAWIEIYSSSEPGRGECASDNITSWINRAGATKGTIAIGSRHRNPLIASAMRITRTRAFVFWEGESSPAVESPDLIFGEDGAGRPSFYVKELEVVNPEEKSDKR